MLEVRVLLAAVSPYVQNPAQDAMTITWFTQENTPGTLTVSLPGGAQVFNGPSVPVLAPELAYHPAEVPLLPGGVDPGAPYKHSIRVGGLNAGTQYDYTVIQGANTYNRHFQTSPADNSSVRFIVYGDSETEPESTGWRTGWVAPSAVPPGSTGRPAGLTTYVVDQTEGYKQNLSLIESRNPDFVGIAGDIVQSGGEQRDWDEFWRHNAGDIGNIAATTPILAALGNHENYGGPGGFGSYTDSGVIRARDKFKTYFETPDNGSGVSTFEDRYFRYDYGPITFISLDITNGLPDQSSQDTNFAIGAGPNLPDFNPGSTQYQWLEAQLADAQANSQFTFVQFHHVPYSVGPHGFPAGTGGNAAGFDNQSGVPVRVLTPLFAQYGVDAVFAGHDEMYERSVVNGIQFYDAGIGGDDLRGPSSGPDGSTGLPSTNPFQQFVAHLDAPEVWNGNQLISGGKHYGHMEVDVFIDTDGFWKAELEPVYNFPLMDSAGNITGWERRVYDDVVVLTAPGIEPMSTVVNGTGNPNRSGISSLTFAFDKPVIEADAGSLNLFNHTTGLPVDLSGAVLDVNGTSVTWVFADGPGGMSDVVLADGRYTAELAANATTPGLAASHAFEFFKLAGDVDGDALVNFNDYFAVRSQFNASGAAYRPGDADGDGLVNFNDYFAVRANFNAGLAVAAYDFGDAPTAAQSTFAASYPTTLADNGARHVITNNTLFLGTAPDAETNGAPAADALGDDNAGSDDEDGITLGNLEIGTTVGLTVTATVPASAVLNAWIDFNRDGDWLDAGEQVFVDEPLANGVNGSLTINVPSGASVGTTYARFRLTAAGGYSYVGLAPNGEVEDYALNITVPPPPPPPLALTPEPQPAEPAPIADPAPIVPAFGPTFGLINQLFFTLSLPSSSSRIGLSNDPPAPLSLITAPATAEASFPVQQRLASDKNDEQASPPP
ncbi:MAG: GEVED domain-containing protein, partial [Planctomycetaceae bacterium]